MKIDIVECKNKVVLLFVYTFLKEWVCRKLKLRGKCQNVLSDIQFWI